VPGNPLENAEVKLPYIDRIWRVKGSLPLEAQSPAEAFEKLDPLFKTAGTNCRIDGDTLTYSNKNPMPQDRLATFTRGKLQIVGSKLTYDLTSPALLFCFLAPFLFLAFGQGIVALGEYEKPTPAEAAKAEEKAKKEEKKLAETPMNPIDKLLGAPAPDKPKKDDEKKKKDKDKEKGGNQRSPTSAYVFAGIFAFLYIVGRILEPWLVRRTFRKTLAGEALSGQEVPAAK
jgi:hypothetical protein